MIKCDLLCRSRGQMSTMPFAKNFLVFRDRKYGLTYWEKVDRVNKMKEMVVFLRKRYEWKYFFLFWKKPRPEELKTIVTVNDKYELYNVDVIQFLMECVLASEIKRENQDTE